MEAMDQTVKSQEMENELKKALKVENKLVAQKDDGLQITLLWIVEARDGVIAQFQESEHYSNLLFTQYFKGFELLRRWMLKHQGEAIDLSTLDFEAVDIKMIANEAKEKERRATEEVSSILADIEAKVGVETATVGADIVTTERGEATNKGVNEQTVIAPIDHPLEQA